MSVRHLLAPRPSRPSLPGMRALSLALGLVLACGGIAAGDDSPPGTEVARNCFAAWEFVPTFRDGVMARFQFEAHAHAPIFMVNAAREAAQRAARRCAEAHWESQLMDPPPEECLNDSIINYPDYPSLMLEAARQLCESNPGHDRMLVDIYFRVLGHEGCGRHYPWNMHLWNQRYPINCAMPFTQGHILEPQEEAGGFGEGSLFENSETPGHDGSGGGGGGAPEPLPEPPLEPPASASYTLLPGIRLPGNDLRLIELGAPEWMLCRQACTDEPACGAWTYRAPNLRSGPLCLLKSRAGLTVPDSCCRSGIRR